jgi:hypothetical protein
VIHTLELTMEEASRILVEHLRLNVPCCADAENGAVEFHLEPGKDDKGYPTCRIKKITVTCNHKQAATVTRMTSLETIEQRIHDSLGQIERNAVESVDNPFPTSDIEKIAENAAPIEDQPRYKKAGEIESE